MSKEMYAAPELEVFDLSGEDVMYASIGGEGTDSGPGNGDWGSED